jgi:two-component system, NtrC family, sensor kinase
VYAQLEEVDLVPNDTLDPALVADLRRKLAACCAERDSALAQQAASAEILRVINHSPRDLTPVFDVILEKATQIGEATFGIVYRFDGDVFRVETTREATPGFIEYLRRQPPRPDSGHALGRLLQAKQPVHIVDIKSERAYTEDEPTCVAAVEIAGARTFLAVPMLREDRLIGAIAIYRQEVRPFSDTQIDMARSFANTAVIAIENARLLGELSERTRDLQESREYQTATSDVLKVISRSTFDLQPVLDTLVETAARLCQADLASINNRDGEVYRVAASFDYSPDLSVYARNFPMTPGRGTVTGRAALERQVVHVADLGADAEYAAPGWVTHGKVRTALGVPLLREGEPIGVIFLARRRVEPFTERQIELVRTFADQAVIGIENARLLGELRESLEQQTATTEVLQVINASPGDLKPVFDAILEKAHHLCGATNGLLVTKEGEYFRAVATRGVAAGEIESLQRPFQAVPNSPYALLSAGERVIHIADLAADTRWDHNDQRRARAIEHGLRTMLFIPLRKDNTLLGYISANRYEMRPFLNKEIKLLEGFAAQAVIAIESGRLLGELRERTHDLQESLKYQTATSDVLKVISRSAFDLQPVLDTLVETAARLCSADDAGITLRDGEVYRYVATASFISSDYSQAVRGRVFKPGRGTMAGRVALEGKVVHVADITTDPDYAFPEGLAVSRTLLGVPLLRDGVVFGTLTLSRQRVEPFTQRQVELVQTFADQAVIAVENARLLGELRARTDELARREAELRVTFDNMGDGVVMFDGELKLAAWNRNFQGLLDMPDAFLAARPSYADYIHRLAAVGEFRGSDIEAETDRRLTETHQPLQLERTRPDGRVIEVRRNPVPGGGFVLIYSDITERKRAEAEIRAARDDAERALGELKAAQANLIQAEKMASLGQLTAGIAHEIKNPLNFVNNFASLSNELLTELKDIATPALKTLDDDRHAELDEVVGMLAGNLDKIVEHGRRADGIVKSMLAHSRGGSGDRQAVDLNALIEESLNLAYHGARAQDQNFNITLEREFDEAMQPIELVPQDITRVFLNLFGNGFYAANKRARAHGDSRFRPMLRVATHDTGDAVEIRVRDNGVGIPLELRDKLFQPFFTTKPTGEGTGLGLSISYDIVTQQHGGAIAVNSEEGVFTEFTVRLPRDGRASQAKVHS